MIEPKKEQLKKTINYAKNIGQRYTEIGRHLLKEGQRLLDETVATEQVINLPFKGIDYEAQNEFWEGIVLIGSANLEQFTNYVPVPSTSASAVDQIYNLTPALLEEIDSFPKDKQEQAAEALTGFRRLIESTITKGETINILIKCGFNKGFGGKLSPLNSFLIGYTAFENPVTDENPTVTSLIPIRSCIDDMIAELLRRRVTQEPASGARNKVLSIGNQMKYNSVIDAVVTYWADEYHKISNELSVSKNKISDRDEWAKVVQKAMNFINGFLNILDPNKMK
jgi:hypothetical protein